MDIPGLSRLGNRLGDNADMCIIELVDYNELLLEESGAKKTKTRRSRRGGKKTGEETVEAKSTDKDQSPKKEKADKVDQVAAQKTTEKNVDVKESSVEEQTEAAKADAGEEVEEINDVKVEGQTEEKPVAESSDETTTPASEGTTDDTKSDEAGEDPSEKKE